MGRRRRDLAVSPPNAERDAAGARGQMEAACRAVRRELRQLERVMAQEPRLPERRPPVRETGRLVA